MKFTVFFEGPVRSMLYQEAIVEFEADHAKLALPRLIASAAERRHAHDLPDGIREHSKLDDRQLRALSDPIFHRWPTSLPY